MSIRKIVGLLIVVFATAASPGQTPVGTAFTYHGHLKQEGSPVNGTVALDFTLWNDPTGTNPGNQIGATQSMAGASVSNGLFTVQLNGGGEFGANAFNGEARWLKITVNGTTLSPRQELTATPYAHLALRPWATSGSDISYSLGKVGIGTPSPAAALDVIGTIKLDAFLLSTGAAAGRVLTSDGSGHGTWQTAGVTLPYAASVDFYGTAFAVTNTYFQSVGLYGNGKGAGVRGVSADFDGYGVHGVNDRYVGVYGESSNGYAVFGRSHDGIGVLGVSDSYFGVRGDSFGHYGVRGVYGGESQVAIGSFAKSGVWGDSSVGNGVIGSTSGGSTAGVVGYGPSGYGVYGNSGTGTAVYGTATAASGATHGGWFETASTSGRGVYGNASATTGSAYGGEFRSASASARGVFGWATSSTGSTNGGWFQSASSSGNGVVGQATAGSGVTHAVIGENFSTSGRGVLGVTRSTTGITYGVYGESDSAAGFDFYAGGAGTNYGSSSSKRWKSSIKPIGKPLDKLGRLRGVYFNWDARHGGQHDVGMIAEEVGAVLPEIVNYEENGVDAIGMDYSKMTPLLVQAVNALRAEKDAELAALRTEKDAQICEQQNQISEQQKGINELNARLERLERVMLQSGQSRKVTD